MMISYRASYFLYFDATYLKLISFGFGNFLVIKMEWFV